MSIPILKTDSSGKELPDYYCPTCLFQLDAATDPNGTHRPGPGDFTVCGRCGEPLRYDFNMKLRRVNIHDLIQASPEVRREIETIQKAIRRDRPFGLP